MFGGFIMVLTQIVMLAIMTMTPVHMENNGHSLNAIGIVWITYWFYVSSFFNYRCIS